MYKDLLICVSYIFSALFGMILIKAGHIDKPFLVLSNFGIQVSLKTFLGIILYGISFCIFTFGISKLQVSIVIPVVSGIYCLLTLVVGIMLFKEHVTFGQFWGIGMIIIGTIIVGALK